MHSRFPKSATLAVAVTVALAANGVHAAKRTTTAPTIEVTARRSATEIDAALAAVRVIDRAEIERRQAGDLLELLRGEPGIDITRSGGVGQTTTLFLRGSNSNHALVLVDGARVASANSGLYDFAHLPLADVERIEIVRGPRAAFWGSDAIGGVVQIFTRKVDGFAGRVTAGKYGRLGTDVSFGGRGERGEMSLTIGQEQTDGFSATNEGAFGHDPDRDGYENNHARFNAASSIGEQIVRFAAQGTEAEVDFDQGVTEAENSSAVLSVEGEIGEGWTHHAAFGHSREDLATAAYFSAYEARRSTFDWHHQYTLGEATSLSGGFNYARERGAELETFGNSVVFGATRHNRAGYLGVQHEAGQHRFELTGRYDDNSAFGGEGTFQAAWGWQLADSTRLRASYGEGFRAPSLNELYSPGYGGLFAGNPDLQPEQSDTAELGLRQDFGRDHSLEASLYRSRIDDLIAYAGGELFQAINIARADIDGLELEYNGRVGAFSIVANATLQDAENRDTGLDLLRRPGRKGTLRVDYRWDSGATLGVETFGSGTRDDFDGELPGYGLVHVVGSLPIGDRWRLGLRLENVGDRDYAVLSGYNTPGRGAYVTVAYGE
jgi:vitamin B12 transporter